MSESLNVIALISGGKDSIYSILHCLQNGHKVVALGNLYPLPRDSSKSRESHVAQEVEADEDDLNSYMYQTVGHTVIPLYEQALGIPLYRQPILGDASATDATYEKPANGVDETESLVPLLQRIVATHPEANAVSTGAILSTYQRTRVESVALRLGLVPLSFLWRYPFLPPESQISLLMDMASIGLDARIIKIASWSLNESFLWQNVATGEVMRKVERAMARFRTNEDGAALGEGGEFETLVLDGPNHLFKGRIVVDEDDRRIIKGSADTAWCRVNRARVEMKTYNENVYENSARIPSLLSDDFLEVSQTLDLLAESEDFSSAEHQITDKIWLPHSTKIPLRTTTEGQKWMIVGHMQPDGTVEEEVEQIIAQIKPSLEERDIDVAEVISTVIILRSMGHFAIVNKIYGSFFTKPNPPARVTIACGEVLPPGCNVVVQLSISSRRGVRRSTDDLHVQSRSYWAPANIGPYSQARSDVIEQSTGTTGFVHVAGQIPLVPSTMALSELLIRPSVDVGMMTDLADSYQVESHQFSNFIRQAVLSLQHLWRIGQAMDISYWTGAVAYLSKDTFSNVPRKAKLAARAWSKANGGEWHERFGEENSELSDEGEPDLWEEHYHMAFIGREAARRPGKKLPDWSVVKPECQKIGKGNVVYPKQLPVFFAAEVEELPRDSDIEWHALLGVTHGPIKQMLGSYHKIGSAFKYIIVNKFSQTFVFLNYTQEIQDLTPLLDMLLSEVETPEEASRRKSSPGYYHSYAAYLDACIAGLWNTESYAGAIPCRSLWGDNGQRLAAVLVFQSFLEPGDFEVDKSICLACGEEKCCPRCRIP